MSKLAGKKDLYTSDSNDWETGPEIFEPILDFEGIKKFDLDPCCSSNSIPARIRYKFPKRDGLVLPWTGGRLGESPLVFVNPPYGLDLKKFTVKAHQESEKGARIWFLAPVRLENIYQHVHGLEVVSFTTFIKGKPTFLKNGVRAKGKAPFPVMLLRYGPLTELDYFQWPHFCEGKIRGTTMLTPAEHIEGSLSSELTLGRKK